MGRDPTINTFNFINYWIIINKMAYTRCGVEFNSMINILDKHGNIINQQPNKESNTTYSHQVIEVTEKVNDVNKRKAFLWDVISTMILSIVVALSVVMGYLHYYGTDKPIIIHKSTVDSSVKNKNHWYSGILKK